MAVTEPSHDCVAASPTSGDTAVASKAGSNDSAVASSVGSDDATTLAVMDDTVMDDTVMESVDAVMNGDAGVEGEEAIKALLRASFLDHMDFDTRPTFVAEAEHVDDSNILKPVFRNKALESDKLLNSRVSGGYAEESSNISWTYTYHSFKDFVSLYTEMKDPSEQFMFQGFLWIRYLAFNRWIVVSGTPLFRPSTKPKLTSKPGQTSLSGRKRPRESDGLGGQRKVLTTGKPAKVGTGLEIYDETALRNDLPHEGKNAPLPTVFDWTLRPLDERASKHLRYARETDWANTPLGPISTWSPVLRTFSNLVMNNPDPAVMFWEANNIMIYNERYRELIGPEDHATCMGTNVFVRTLGPTVLGTDES
jgi:hypothetical protein